MEHFSRDLAWHRTDRPGAEHVLIDERLGLRARGTVIGADPRPYTVRYSLITDERWNATHVEVESEGAGWRRRVRLEHASGVWRVTTTEQGTFNRTMPGIEDAGTLKGAADVDLAASPLFNTLLVRRRDLLAQPVGTSETYLTAFVSVPDLVVAPAEQTYTVLGDGRVHFVSGAFDAELEFDADGYVQHYPGLAVRI